MGLLSFTKKERLTGEIRINRLFGEGEAFICYPFRIVFRKNEKKPTDIFDAKVVVIVPKKRFKRAVKRNLLKRRMREAYRKNKSLLYAALKEKDFMLDFSISYVSNDMLEYVVIEKKMKETIDKLIQKLQ